MRAEILYDYFDWVAEKPKGTGGTKNGTRNVD
jgi:hypothetical protein